MRRALNSLMLTAPVLLVACEVPQAGDTGMEAPVDTSAVEAEVTEVRDSWVQGALAGDAAAVASLYTEDAVLVGADGEALRGPQAIQEGLAPDFAVMTSLEVNSTGMEIGRDLVTDMGTYSQTVRTPEGQEQTVSGHYLVVLRRQPDGSWRLTQHLSSTPPPPRGEGM